MKISLSDFKNINFSDQKIESMLIDNKLRILEIKIGAAHFKIDDNWIEKGPITMRLVAWGSISVSLYDTKKAEWIFLQENEYDVLKEINEIEVTNNQISLRGFGKIYGQWTQYLMDAPEIDMIIGN